jgi:hypothetical protein
MHGPTTRRLSIAIQTDAVDAISAIHATDMSAFGDETHLKSSLISAVAGLDLQKAGDVKIALRAVQGESYHASIRYGGREGPARA